MKYLRQKGPSLSTHFAWTFRLWAIVLPVCVLMAATGASAQQEEKEPPPVETHATTTAEDVLLPQITAAIQGVTTPEVSTLAKALRIGEKQVSPGAGASLNTLTAVGDLDGGGVPEMLLKVAMPDVVAGAEVAPAPESQPLWSVYLLCWDGAHWKASRLLAQVEDFSASLVNLGPPAGRGLAVIIEQGDSPIAYPVIFQVKDHVAALLWDGQADDSRYEPLLQCQVRFQDHADAPAEMIVTGRANPGFLQVKPNGQRGFQARATYHWDGKGFVPAKTEYIADPDYTVYRFIAALHLHDYRSAYALVVPARFLNTDAPTLEAFRQFIQDNWPEFLQDEVFQAPELPAGSPDEHLFLLSKPDRRFVYHPVFSIDGRFLLTGLTRTREAIEP